MAEKDKDFLEGLAISAACHVLPARKVFREPIAYSYNGVILPKLPEWDREAYPYAWITNAKRNLVYFTDKPMMRCTGANGGKVFAINGNNHAGQEVSVVIYQLSTDGTKFEMSMEFDNTDALLLVTQNAPLWTNYDVIDVDDGSVYFAASDPIPVYKFFGYSYNGTILPQLPAWDIVTYPYAYITDYDGNSGDAYKVYVGKTLAYRTDDKGERWFELSEAMEATFDNSGSEAAWSDFSEYSGWFGSTTYTFLVVSPWHVWTNFDMTNSDGSVYLAASEPIPIYE